MPDLAEDYLDSMLKRFENIKELGDGALAQLDDADVAFALDPESNSIAVTVQHLHGNMLSRWTDFLTTDGDKPDRDRDGEFEERGRRKDETISLWEAGWACTFQTLRALGPGDLQKIVTIRGMPLVVIDAISRQIAHYAYHVGQIVQIAKHRRGAHWKTLSIARGQSGRYVPRAKD
jgi:hypothetical protein